MKEQLIVTLTTWEARIGNIPAVLDSIYKQTLKPDLVVLNLAYDLVVPADVQAYLDDHGVEVNRMPDWKVYKKLIPTLKKHPGACVVSIDDDWLYPEGMLEEFMRIHEQYPSNPISGNRVYAHETYFHCGCASLTKSEFFGKYLDCVDKDMMRRCQSDDTVYTFLQKLNGYTYVQTENLFYENMVPFNPSEPFSTPTSRTPVYSWRYLCDRFGHPEWDDTAPEWRKRMRRFLKLFGIFVR